MLVILRGAGPKFLQHQRIYWIPRGCLLSILLVLSSRAPMLQMINTARLKLVQAFPDVPPAGHVSLAPADGSLIEEWAATRGTPEVSPFTQDIIDAIIDTIRAP